MTQRTHGDRDDAELISGCRNGDESAWSAMIDRYGRLVYSVPARLRLPPDGCDDVFQEVFATVLRTLPGLRDNKSLPKWLMTIAYHAACRWARRNTWPSGPADPALPDAPPEDDLVRWERQDLVRRALARVGGPCERLLLALFRDDGSRAYQDIAAQLGMPVGSIGPTRNRCLRKLLTVLEEMTPDEAW